MIVVTGAAGFIGQNVVQRILKEQNEELLLVDRATAFSERRAFFSSHVTAKATVHCLDKSEFLHRFEADALPQKVHTVIHLGACTSTLEKNEQYLFETNTLYSQRLARAAIERGVRFIYASSAATYGNGRFGFSDDEALLPQLQPLNPYGWSKHRFDEWILKNRLQNQCVGLKFFNVFGPHESHKGAMASVAWKAFLQLQEQGFVKLFRSERPDYADGEQLRDFIYVDDVVDVILASRNTRVNGIFNLGSGRPRSWNDLVAAVCRALGKPFHVTYIPLPEEIRVQYQYVTCAEMGKLTTALHQIGVAYQPRSLENAMESYFQC